MVSFKRRLERSLWRILIQILFGIALECYAIYLLIVGWYYSDNLFAIIGTFACGISGFMVIIYGIDYFKDTKKMYRNYLQGKPLTDELNH